MFNDTEKYKMRMNKEEVGGFKKVVKQNGRFDDGTGKKNQFNTKKSKKGNFQNKREFNQ